MLGAPSFSQLLYQRELSEPCKKRMMRNPRVVFLSLSVAVRVVVGFVIIGVVAGIVNGVIVAARTGIKENL
jgi:hypothetical protein